MQTQKLSEKNLVENSNLLNKFNEEKNNTITETEFEKLSPPEKRMTIAKDVLKWVAAGALKPERNTYMRKYIDNSARKQFTQEELVAISQECHVCAKGALFMANLFERGEGNLEICSTPHTAMVSVNSGDSLRFWHNESPMLKYFEEAQWNLIEKYFESGWYSGVDSTRLVHIMENIIKNNGEFIPYA